jgi:Uma2 family endonuclease
METAALKSEADDILYEDDEDAKGEFYYGYRTNIEYDENGETVFTYSPLTADDFLDPEEGDVYIEGNLHEKDLTRLKSIFRHHLEPHKNITVYSNLKIIWGIEGLQNPAPDISVFENVKDPEKPRGEFRVAEEGTKPFFVLEVVSPRYRNQDVSKKPRIYETAGISEYIIADPGLRKNEIFYTLKGYRLIGGKYREIKPNAKGEIASVTTGVRIGVNETGDRLIVYDMRTDKEILCDKDRADQTEAELNRLKEKLKAMGISAE